MAKTTLLRARVDSARKIRADKILGRYGLTPAQAINVFYAKVDEADGLPFDLRPDETAEWLANPEFMAHLTRVQAGRVKYSEAKDIPA
jgi:addiction module RelB/DinJ family antitoxin